MSDNAGETLLTCPALNGRHLLLALRLSLLQPGAAGRALARPSPGPAPPAVPLCGAPSSSN
ncbi:hypothetical protein EYF80_035155 [Liparis tanakae]|uniref:Uncharacterized protein n=1 Tax=Liparis tanakae TaxID=230148 RepID=A0A4Z2GPC7_9TELE|nr:hypothetical protein EYF80_035155 [Liparis tanakae]